MRMHIPLLLLALWVGSSWTNFAHAAAPKAAEVTKTEAKTAHPEDEDKMAFTGIQRYDLFFYTLIVFGLLYFILKKFAWGKIAEGLQKQEDTIRQTHTDAEAARNEAQKFLAEIRQKLDKASDDVRLMLEEARRDAVALKDRMKSEAIADIQSERDRSRREIEMARDTALQDMYNQAVQLASLMSSKAVRRELTQDDHRRLLDETLSELKLSLAK